VLHERMLLGVAAGGREEIAVERFQAFADLFDRGAFLDAALARSGREPGDALALKVLRNRAVGADALQPQAVGGASALEVAAAESPRMRGLEMMLIQVLGSIWVTEIHWVP